MTIITTALALSSALLAPAAPLHRVSGTAHSDVSAITTTQAQTAITPTIPSADSTPTARPQVSGTAPGATRVAWWRGRELMGSGGRRCRRTLAVYMLRELTPGVNDMQLLASTPAGTVSSAYHTHPSTPGTTG